jgi:tetratricopeptide (TPR) repeat protein
MAAQGAMRRSPMREWCGAAMEFAMDDKRPDDEQPDEGQPEKSQPEKSQPAENQSEGSEASEYERSAEFQRILNESARLLGQNRPGEAVTRLLPLHDAAPANADVAINLGGAYILQRKWNRAVKVLRRAVAANADNAANAMLWTNLGAAELGALETSGPKQQESAIAAYQKALAADPNAPNVHYHLGLIYAYRGENIRAGAFFQRAVEVNPADRDAHRWIERLQNMQDDQADDDGERGDGQSHTSSGPTMTGRGTAADGESPFSLN